MQRKRSELVPIGEVIDDLDGPVKAIRDASPQALHHFTQAVLVQTGKRIGDNGLWRIAKLNGILYFPDVGSKTTSFSSAFAGIFASN